MQSMMKQFRPALRAIAIFTFVLGILYSLGMTGLAQVLFPDQADGSMIERNGEPVASSLIGQSFVDPETGRALEGYFRGRPSAVAYNGAGSGASNLGPTSAVLQARIDADSAIIREENALPDNVLIPVDLVTASASGLDPHISPASADLQVARVASERGMSEEEVRALVDEHTDRAVLGVIGEDRVNMVELNLALDERSGQ
jgi:K+-transporting ATPase ATPase C chain